MDWDLALADEAARELDAVGPLLRAADPGGLLTERSAALCAGLAHVARLAAVRLGSDGDAAVRVASLLSLLTKLDDQVIDALPFHGGALPERRWVRERTRRFLAPTLASIRGAAPATDEPRCRLAAAVGAAARAIDGPEDRFEAWFATVAHGWEVQVEAVATFTAHPASVAPAHVAGVTAAITGAWFRMLVATATLSGDARPLTPAESAGFDRWGGPIQRADALADLGKDLADAHLATAPGRALWDHVGRRWVDVVGAGDEAAAYALVAETGTDLAMLPDVDELAAADDALADLPEIADLLRWVHGLLLWRYLAHPACRRSPSDAAFAPHLGQAASYARSVAVARGVACSAR